MGGSEATAVLEAPLTLALSPRGERGPGANLRVYADAGGGAVVTKPAARLGDRVLQTSPHCHAPIHPPAPVPTPSAHPPLPLTIVKGAGTVMIGGMPAARVLDTTTPCTLPACVPNGPGMIAMGSATVLIENFPAARAGDMSSHTGCVAPIPGPVGNVLPPCCPNVLIGG